MPRGSWEAVQAGRARSPLRAGCRYKRPRAGERIRDGLREIITHLDRTEFGRKRWGKSVLNGRRARRWLERYVQSFDRPPSVPPVKGAVDAE